MSEVAGRVLKKRYRMDRLLGRGGMADVYLAFDMQRQTYVAIKLIREDLADDADFIRRFSREASALEKLDHPNIVRFYGTEQDEGLSFIVMDYVPGSTLQRRLAQAGGPLPLPEVTAILHQIGPALNYAHTMGFIHRDVKPGNIMLRDDGTALLSDFGAARAAESSTLMTVTLGTPAYMSPEQILGKDLEPRSDLYSLGLVLYEMVAGRRPFTGDEEGLPGTGTLTRLREAHLRLDPPNPIQFNPAIPGALADVILKALSKNVGDRWPSVVSLVEAWDSALGGGATVAGGALTGQPTESIPTMVATAGSMARRAGAAAAAPPSAATPMPGPPVQPPAAAPVAQPTPRSRSPWVIIGAAAAVVVIALAAWRFVLPGLAASRSPSTPPAQVALVSATQTSAAESAASASMTAEAESTASAQRATAESARQAATVAVESTQQAQATAEAANAQATRQARDAAAAATVEAQSAQLESLAAQATALAETLAATQEAASYAATAAAVPTATPQPTATATPEPTATAEPTARPAPTNTRAPARPLPPGVIVNFESPTTWRRGSQPYGELTQSAGTVHSGSYSGKLDYNFPAVKDNFVVFQARPAIPIADTPSTLYAWVYGDGSGAFLNAWLQDGSGQVRQYTFGQIKHTGWQQMSAPIDDSAGWPNVHISGPDSGKLSYPISFNALVLDGVPDGVASKGTIYIDDITTSGQGAQQSPVSSTVRAPAPVAAQIAAPAAPLQGHIAVPIFASDRKVYDLYAGNIDGSNFQRVRTQASQPSLRADGRQIAFRDWNGSDRGISVMDTYGGNQHRVTNYGEDGLPAYSPDGQNLVFESAREPDRKNRIYVANIGSHTDRPLTDGTESLFGVSPIWLSNGHIVYQSYYPREGISAVNQGGSAPVLVADDTTAASPASSPDGRYIAYMSRRDGNWNIYRVGIDGSGLARLTDSGASDGLPAWSPDGKSIAFVSDREAGWAVWAMNADGSNQRRLFSLPGSPDGTMPNTPGYNSQGWVTERMSWSQ
jgi:tRNA A-37 threonylcarbamoyl transferase component Bud32